MFPATITLHSPEQLAAVMAALYPTTGAVDTGKPAIPASIKKDATEKPAKPAALPTGKDAIKALVAPESAAGEPSDLTGSKNAGQAVEALDNQHATPKPGITFDQLKAKFVELSKAADGRQKVIDVLARSGAKKLPELKPEFYDQAAADIDRVLAGGEA